MYLYDNDRVVKFEGDFRGEYVIDGGEGFSNPDYSNTSLIFTTKGYLGLYSLVVLLAQRSTLGQACMKTKLYRGQ